jgi:hypothetical protein
MHIFGWIEPDLRVEKLDWSATRVAELGIHPWKLDLLDPNPIIVEDEGRQLRFSRLNDVKFAYRDAEGRVILGLCDNGEQACVACRISKMQLTDVRSPIEILTLEKVECLDDRFSEHFGEYMRRIFESNRAELVYDLTENVEYIQGGGLQITAAPVRDARELYPFKLCEFDGEMMKERHFRADWPEWVVSLLELLQPWTPAVIGCAPRDLLLGRPIKHVDIELLSDSTRPTPEWRIPNSELSGGSKRSVCDDEITAILGFEPVTEAMQKAGHKLEEPRRFRINGGSELTCAMHPPQLRKLSFGQRIQNAVRDFVGRPDACKRIRPSVNTSAEDAFGVNGEIIAGRIAVHDLSLGQSRALVRPHLKPLLAGTTLPERYPHLEQEGLRLLPDPLSPWHIADGCHCEPIVPAYINAFRTATCIDWESKGSTYDFEQVLNAYAVPLQRPGGASGTMSHTLVTSIRSLASLDEGEGGMSPQQMHELLRAVSGQAFSKFERGCRCAACVTSFDVSDHLRHSISSSQTLSGKQQDRWLWILTQLDKHVRKKLAAIFQFASINNPETLCQEMFEKYLAHLFASMTDSNVRLPNGGVVPVDHRFLENIEHLPPLQISSAQALRFRSEVHVAVMAARQEGFQPTYLTHQGLGRAIEAYVLQQVRDSTGVMLTSVRLGGADRYNKMTDRLEHVYGYCPGCREELLQQIALTRDFLCA